MKAQGSEVGGTHAQAKQGRTARSHQVTVPGDGVRRGQVEEGQTQPLPTQAHPPRQRPQRLHPRPNQRCFCLAGKAPHSPRPPPQAKNPPRAPEPLRRWARPAGGARNVRQQVAEGLLPGGAAHLAS